MTTTKKPEYPRPDYRPDEWDGLDLSWQEKMQRRRAMVADAQHTSVTTTISLPEPLWFRTKVQRGNVLVDTLRFYGSRTGIVTVEGTVVYGTQRRIGTKTVDALPPGVLEYLVIRTLA